MSYDDALRTPVQVRGEPATLWSDHRPGAPAPPGTSPRDARPAGWAVVEIRADGSWGTPQLVTAGGPVQAVAAARALASAGAPQVRDLSPVLNARVGSLHAGEGRLHQAAAVLARGARASSSGSGRAECLGRLAHVLALQGDLPRAELLASSLPSSAPAPAGSGAEHARTARAWVALLRADFTEARCLLGPDDLVDAGARAETDDAWWATSTLLVRSHLLVATGEPDAATRLLAADAEVRHGAQRPGWLADLLRIARSEALLAAGDVKRSLALLTPMPPHAPAIASVLTATARLRVGDTRGARSVLAVAEESLDQQPLPVQMQAWLLEARLADERADHARAELLLDRTLRAAATTGTLLPLMRHWPWTRHQVDRCPALLHAYRDLLNGCHFDAPRVPRPRTVPPTPDGAPAAPLTEREEQVLELLAQMFSTEEIAGELFISVNTVKTHLKGIFGKLCVNRRVDAVRRGRQLGLC